MAGPPPARYVRLAMAFTTQRSCPRCATQNRVPASHLADAGTCGACHAELPPQREPLEVDPRAFDEVVAASRVPVLVDFWAAWCGPCRAAAPEVHRLAQELAGRAVVLKVDTEAHPELAARFGVQAIPNFAVLVGGRTVLQQAGLVPRAELRRWLEQAATQAAQT